MLIEDDKSKSKDIIGFIKEKGFNEVDIIHVKNMSDFSANLSKDIGLFIIDIMLPNVDEGKPSKNGKEILESIVKAGKRSLMLAISSHPEDFPDLRSFYEERGCILADYRQKKSWKTTLEHLLILLKMNPKFDFLVFCALDEERAPYVQLFPNYNRTIRNDIDCLDIKIEDKRGSIVLLPKMGLVNAAIVASLFIEKYSPSLVGMSGICGGFSNQVSLGQLVISNMAYEYQSGKWSTDGFKQEPYQVSTNQGTLARLNLLIDDNLLSELELGFRGSRPNSTNSPKIGIFTSGSAVIADQKRLEEISSIHRKVSALDMEVFAIQRAAELSLAKPPCICAKTVVDLCDQEKDDVIHNYGSYISAKFMIKAISDFFKSDSMSMKVR